MKNKLIITTIFSLMLLAAVSGFAGENWVHLDKGWNLVYGFAEPVQLQGQSLEQSHIKAIYALIPQTQEYFRMWPNLDNKDKEKFSAIMDIDDILQMPLWVYSDIEADTEYWLQDLPKPIDGKALYKGWNFIAISIDDFSKFTVNELRGDCNIDKTYQFSGGFWDDDTDKWLGWTINEKIPLPTVSNDKFTELLVKVSDNCKMGASGEILSVPQLPQ
jgi:hypothetical protein